MAVMSPRLKPLLLPQMVEERKKMEIGDLSYAYYTTNSSSSDVTSPVTPTFSAKGHYRGSSSTSSLDLPYAQVQDSPASPTQQITEKSTIRQLPDVKEEPFEREDEPRDPLDDQFELYSCLCDAPCEHRSNHGRSFSMERVPEYDLDYEMGCMSDYELPSYRRNITGQDGTESPFLGLTTRLGSRFNTINRWKSTKKISLMASPTTEVSFENVLSRTPSALAGRSSSMPSSDHRLQDRSNVATSAPPSVSHYSSMESIDAISEDEEEMSLGVRGILERDRAKATTPLLPPLMTSPLAAPPQESPLQSPTIATFSAGSELPSPNPVVVNFSRPSLSAKPSFTSLRLGPNGMDLPLPLPAILQEHDDWSDRLGHANFTITPQPYELEIINLDTVRKFRDDWEAARVNYTKHLVRTGENYGGTSKIYRLTEDKWAETEKRWRDTYDSAIKQTLMRDPTRARSISAARSRSRGRGRGRSESASAFSTGRRIDDVLFADEEWRRLDDPPPSIVPRLMDANGKFPERGDEDIVGPMHRAEAMVRSQSEDKHAKFWKNLVEKVGLRK